MFSFKRIFFLLFALNFWTINAEISDQRLCIDEKCSEQVGIGKTLIRYPPNADKRILSFPPNTPVKIFSYGAGSKPNYLGVEIDGVRGYVSKEYIRETKLIKKPTLLVPTEGAKANSPPPQKPTPEIKADSVQEQYEIIDGTKIPIYTGFASTPGSAEPIGSTEPPLVTQGPLSGEKTEDLKLDLNKKQNIITSQTKSLEEESLEKQPESIPKTLEEQKVENIENLNTDSLEKVKNVDKNLVNEALDNKKEEQNNKQKEEHESLKNVKTIENIKLAEKVQENNLNKNNEPDILENPDNAEFDGDQEDDDDENDEADENDIEDDEFEESEEENEGFFKTVMNTLERFTKEDEIPDKTSDAQVKSTGIVDNQVTTKAQDQAPKTEPTGENSESSPIQNPTLVLSESAKEIPSDLFLSENINTVVNNEKLIEQTGPTAEKSDSIPIQNPTQVLTESSKEILSDQKAVVNNEKVAEQTGPTEEKSDSIPIQNPTQVLSESAKEIPFDPLLNKNINKVVNNEKLSKQTGPIVDKSDSISIQNPAQVLTESANEIPSDSLLNENIKTIVINEKQEHHEEFKIFVTDSPADTERTTPSVFDDDILPIDNFVTPDPLKLLDIENKVKMVDGSAVENQETLKMEEAPNSPKDNTQDLEDIGALDLNNQQISENKNNETLEQVNRENEINTKIRNTNFTVESISESNNVLKEIKENLLEESNSTAVAENILENIDSSELFKESRVSFEETNFDRPDLGPNKPTFIDEPKIPEDLINILEDEKPTLPPKNSGGLLFGLSSLFSGGVSGSEEVQQAAEAGTPSYDEAIKESDVIKEITEEPFVKTEAYITGDTDANINSEDFNENNVLKTEENVIKTIDTQKLAADRSSYSYSLNEVPNYSQEKDKIVWSSTHDQCDTDQCFDDVNIENTSNTRSNLTLDLILQSFSSELFLYLSTTAVSMIIFLFLYIVVDKFKREAPLIARINKLEQELLATRKENQILQEQDSTLVVQQSEPVIQGVPNEVVEELTEQLREAQATKLELEEQIAALEKELDNSTEVGTELNKIITDMLNSADGSDILKENVEEMEKKLAEQQETINSITDSLNLKNTENHELQLELEISKKNVVDLQGEVDEMAERIVKIKEERDAQQISLEKEIEIYQVKIQEATNKEGVLSNVSQLLRTQLAESQRTLELKIKELDTLKDSIDQIQSMKNNKDSIKSLLDVTEVKAQLEQFKSENARYSEQLRLERESNGAYVTKIQALIKELGELRADFEKADKEKVEVRTKLEVLNNYFKEKEQQMQKEISKYESLWAVKKGEATSTTERIRLLQEELQNYKAQNESLKQEVMNQEVELKSQISVLEKKAHESWMTHRQMERKLEDAKHEAAQLRNRLTMKERAALEGNRMQSPLRQNGELPLSPPPLDATLSPPLPLIGNHRDLTMSPPMSGIPPLPFLPPPPGAFMIPPPGAMPPPGLPPFMPPPMFPVDHRPPPLGRMSSPPPLNRSYSPESTIYSEYDRFGRRSPSPIYDSEYGASPPNRAYSPYEERLRDERLRDDRRDFRRDDGRRDYEYNRPHGRSNGRTSKGFSSGSEAELGKINRKPNKKV